MSFLEKIRKTTLERVEALKRNVGTLQMEVRATSRPLPVLENFRANSGPRIIAEVKRASPSKGAIAPELDPVEIALGYSRSGAAMISVLTEPQYFGGSISDLRKIRQAVASTPLLLKDFVLDPLQLLEARAAGADAALLIHSFLEKSQLQDLYHHACELGLQPLVEVHDEVELQNALSLGAQLIGVNNRNLRTLQIDLSTSARLIAGLNQSSQVFISESGIESAAQLKELQALGYRGFLIGTKLMEKKQPELALKTLIAEAS